MAKKINIHDQVVSNAIGPIMPHPPSLRLDRLNANSPRSSALTPRLSRWVFGNSESSRYSARSEAGSWDSQAKFEQYSPEIYKNNASRRVKIFF